VNETQQAFATRYGSVNSVYEDFKLSSDAATEQLPQLRSAAATLTSLRVRIERLDAPADAEPLRLRLIEFFRQQEAVAEELVAVAVYLPKLAAAEQPLAAVNRRLRSRLQTTAPEAQAAALGGYAVELERVAAELEALEPPRLLQVSHGAYIAQLRDYAAASRALRRAVRDGDQAGVDAAVAQLRNASTAPPGTARAQSAAIVAYNDRVSRIQRLLIAVERERQKLEQEVS